MNGKIALMIVATCVFLVSGRTAANADYVSKVWEQAHPLSQFTTPFAVKTDSRGNVYVTGAAYDNGAGTTVKYDKDGVQKWTRTVGGMALLIDSADNVYTTGASQTAKYDVNGNQVWKKDLQGVALAVDAEENAYVTGSFGTAKIDRTGTVNWTRPEVGAVVTVGSNGVIYVANAIAIGTNKSGAVTYSIDPHGSWATTAAYNGPADAVQLSLGSMKVDASGNTYAVGSISKNSTDYGDMIAVKYDAAGNTLWENPYGSAYSYDWAYTLALDTLGNVYMIGTSSGSGWGTRIVKYDTTGHYQWQWGWSGYARNVAVDGNNDVYFTTASNVLVKMKGNGSYAWSIGTGYYERAIRDTIHFDSAGNVYGVGWRYDSSNRQNYITVKFTQTSPNRAPVANAGPDQTVACGGPGGTTVTLNGSGSSDADGDSLVYTWTWPGGSAAGMNPVVTLPLGVTTITLTVDDGKGEKAQDTVAVMVRDSTPPETSVRSIAGVAGDNGWYRSDVTVTVEAIDGCSGVKEMNTSVDGAGSTVAGSLASITVGNDGNHLVGVSAVDTAGNAEAVKNVIISIDKTAPGITASGPTPNGNGWHNTDVTVTFACSDGGSGIASCTSPVTVTTEGWNVAVAGQAIDRAGNISGASLSLNIDRTGPAITVTGVENGASFELGLLPAVSYGADDALSGVATSNAGLTGGDGLGLGTFTYTVTATDNAGNVSVASVTYQVIATPGGTLALLDSLLTSGQVDPNMAGSLSTKLQAALDANTSTAADGKLQAFINEINAQTGKKISGEAAAVLINAALYMINNN